MECISEKDKIKLTVDKSQNSECLNEQQEGESRAKKQRLSKKQKLRGQNKSRGPTFTRNQEKELCNSLLNIADGDPLPNCERKNCPFLHNIEEYLKIKPRDIG